MIVVLPVCEKDIHLAIRNVEFSISMDKTSPLFALITHESTTKVDALLELAKKLFKQVETFSYDPWTGKTEWPHPQNYAWQETARHIESKVGQPWFWWEADATPLKSGWLDQINEAYENSKRPFGGAVVDAVGSHYMAGVGVYPPNPSAYLLNAMLAQSNPWDIVAGTRDGILRHVHDISPLICHTPDRSNTRFAVFEDVEKIIPETAVLFHKCKDGSLLDVLQGRPVDNSTANHSSAQQSVPSFTEQTNWETGVFAFPVASNTCYFNPSIVKRGDKLLLLTRRYRWNKEQVTEGRESGSGSDLVIWPLRKNLTVDPNPIIPTLPTWFPGEQFEDPKAVMHNGQIHVAMANWVHHKKWPVRQAFLRLSSDMRKSESLPGLIYGGNAPQIENGTSAEKNWNPFFANDAWHFVYKMIPHIVLKTSEAAETFTTESVQESFWEFGQPRGGTPPILMGSEYVSFFHSSLMWCKPRRRYYLGAYCFSAKPPYKVTRMTRKPLLIGSESDFRVLGGPLVVFPNGAVFQDGKFLVTMGINDEACGFVKIPFNDFDGLMEKV